MTNDQYYRLVNSWTNGEWPLELSTKQIRELNTVAPSGYHYADVPGPDDDGPRVELCEYVGESIEESEE